MFHTNTVPQNYLNLHIQKEIGHWYFDKKWCIGMLLLGSISPLRVNTESKKEKKRKEQE